MNVGKSMPAVDVLIVGAGPTGLVLALWLTRLGVRVRLVDKSPAPGQTSRAIAVQARTLELYSQLDLAQPVVSAGYPLGAVNVWEKGVQRAHMDLRRMGEGLSPFPFALVYPQDEHERLLIERLTSMGVHPERPVELVGLQQTSDGVTATLGRTDGTTEICRASYLAGCDGARSFVRQSLNIDFPGGTYSHLFYVADVEASGPALNGEAHIAFDHGDFLLSFPLDGGRRARLIGTVRAEAEGLEGDAIRWGDVSDGIMKLMHLNVSRVKWFSTYHVHHRVVRSFRNGRVFLLGDAAHIHSPVGGQGMNTGIGDAVNLAWKLADVLNGDSDARILDTYEEERIPFARRLVATTDRAFTVVTSSGTVADRMRILAPRLLSTLIRSRTVRRFMFHTVSQIQLNYRGSALSAGYAGHVHGGDRLPWVPGDDGRDNFQSLTSLSWQVHVYGTPPPSVSAVCERRHIPLQVLPWGVRAEQAGLERDALYLLRPDGYVALAAAGRHSDGRLAQFLDSRDVARSARGSN